MLRQFWFPMAFAFLGAYPFYLQSLENMRMGPHRVYCRIGNNVICDFDTTNNWCMRVEWSTNLSATGFVYVSQVVSNKLW